MSSTPYQTSATFVRAVDITSVVTTGSTTTTPYGFTTAAQADGLVATVNSILALLKAQGSAVIQ